MSDKKLLPSKRDAPADWYTTVIRLADLADYGPAKGTMIIKPYGYALWEKVQETMDPQIKARGVDNAYFPLFIPMNLIEKEASHVEGFAPELAVVTHGGGEELEEPLVVRPTSETIMYNSYAKWIQSYRDLPVMMNQWNNVVRWEKRTTPFLRTSEFLWQEGHTAHATHEEATEMQKWAMGMYADIYRDWFAMDGYIGWKSTAERFAGADATLTFESLMPSGKALQACTSHDLGQNFSKSFGISFQTAEGGADEFVWQTSWGFSTRSIGGLILSHGDENGLVLPPKMAPVQVAIVPVRVDDDVVTYCKELEALLNQAGVRTVFDGRDDERFGFKLNKWEVKGVPLTLRIGAQEAAKAIVTVQARFGGEKREFAKDNFADGVATWLEEIQAKMLQASRDYLAANTREAHNYDEFKKIMAEHKGFVKVWWNDNKELEAKIQDETKATSRCQPIEWSGGTGADFYTGEPATKQWVFAQSY
jgi:prolyl-tRNA synthetase